MIFASSHGRFIELYRLSKVAFGRYKFQIGALALFGLLSGLAEGIGINLLIPLFYFVVDKQNNNSDFVSGIVEKVFGMLHLTFNLKYLLIFIATLFIFKAIFKVFLDFINIKITSDYEEKTRTKLFSNTMSASWPYLLKQKLGHLEAILLIDIPNSTDLLRNLSNLIVFSTTLIIYALIALNISFYISLAGLVIGFFIFVGFRPLFIKIKNISKNFVKTNKSVAHLINENLIGMKTVKATATGNQVIERGKNYFVFLRKLAVKTAIIKSLTTSFIQPLSLVFICVTFAIMYKSPNFNIAILGAIVYLIQRIFIYIEQIQKSLHTVTALVPFLGSVIEYEKDSARNFESISGAKDFQFKNELILSDLYFSYDEEKNIIDGINFSVKRGELLGLIGPSGVGKTTLVDLLLRLFLPTKGSILIDGLNINEIDLYQWRQKVGYVSQDVFLMNDSIKNNIKFYNNLLIDEEIETAAKMANIFEYIQTLPDKFETIIGERGVLLSAGQRQRIAIARILAREPEILILDEATSSLDNESEQQIQKVIEGLKGKITVITIAHRLTTVKNCDRLLVLDKGRIFEEGKPDDLLNNKDSYFYKVNNLKD